MHANLLCRGEINGPCIYLMGGEEIKVPSLKGAWLIQVQGADWNRDFSPWPAPKVFSKGDDFSGGGDAYLAALVQKIPLWEKEWGVTPLWRGIAGYSLSGLFSLYALTKTGIFSRCGCFSGSLWYPGWMEYLKKSGFVSAPQAVVFSLGDRKAKRNIRCFLPLPKERGKPWLSSGKGIFPAPFPGTLAGIFRMWISAYLPAWKLCCFKKIIDIF